MSTISKLGDRMLNAMLPKARAAACAHGNGWCSATVSQGGGSYYKLCQEAWNGSSTYCVEYDYTPGETYSYGVRPCC
jgi:hypothetical protein